MKLTKHEIELIDGMIGVWRYHAERCSNLGNSTLAEKQKVRDLARVALLERIKKEADVDCQE